MGNLSIDIDQKYFEEIELIENVLPDSLYQVLLDRYKNPPLTYGWKSHSDNDPHGHWNLNLAKYNSRFNLADITPTLHEIDLDVWNYLKQNIKQLNDHVLIRCYINGYTYGSEGYYHRDSSRKDEYTTVLYLNEKWELDWGGETTFVNEDPSPKIVFSALPQKNSCVVFNSNIQHCGRGVSRKYNGLRLVYVIKSRKKRTEMFEKLSNFLCENGAINHGHKNGTLHDHLVRVYQLLESKGLDQCICLGGGLHSIFGTNAFTTATFQKNDTTKLNEAFGREGVFLARLFSDINRPFTLEQPERFEGDNVILKLNDGNQGTVTKDIYQKLMYIECANLLDQKSLKQERWPNLYKLWNQEEN